VWGLESRRGRARSQRGEEVVSSMDMVVLTLEERKSTVNAWETENLYGMRTNSGETRGGNSGALREGTAHAGTVAGWTPRYPAAHH